MPEKVAVTLGTLLREERRACIKCIDKRRHWRNPTHSSRNEKFAV